jgi:hypothetical protein
MRKIQILGLALFAVFAFGAMAASSALAATGEWLVAKVAVTENLPAETEGLLFLIKLISPTNSGVLVKIDCEGIFDGTIGAAGKDTVTAVLNLSMELINKLGESPELALSCTVVETHSSLEDCNLNSLAEVWPGNLPWTTQLGELLESGGVVSVTDTFGPGTGGEPDYEVMCNDSIGVLGEELCEGPTSALVTNEPGPPPFVLGEFTLAASPETNCPGGTGEKTGAQVGEGKTWAVGGTVATPVELERLETAVN